MSEKKYFWLKLPRNFFEKHYIKMLMAKDEKLVLFYIRLLTEAIDHEGRLRYSEYTPYTAESIAEVTGFPKEFVADAMRRFADMELIMTEDDGTIFLPKSVKMIGSESGSAERVRRFREAHKGEPKKRTQTKKGASAVKPTEEKVAPTASMISEIIDYLNAKTNSRYRASSKSTKEVINARLRDGFSVDDFKLVIDIKAAGWLNDPKMQGFLRPQTLFRPSNFEAYLNEAKRSAPQPKYAGLSERLARETDENIKDIDDKEAEKWK